MNRRHFVAGCGASLITLATAFADVPAELPLTAQEVIDRVAKVYATCATYRDTGCVRHDYLIDGKASVSERAFSTAFVRPDRFRFEFTSKSVAGQPDARYIIWRQDKAVQTWWDLQPGVDKPADLKHAVATCQGVSGRASHTVPALLLPKEMHESLTALTALKRLDDAKLDRRECFRLDGVYGTTPSSFWIDKKSLALLQIQQRHTFGNDSVVSTTAYDPVIDGEVTAKLLAFDPPK